MLYQRRSFSNRLRKIQTRAKQGKDISAALSQLQHDIAKSMAQRQSRQDCLPTISYPEDLPISQKRSVIADAIAKHQVVIIAGETGSGKTTQIPKICLALGRGIDGKIGHTQPRRIAARSVATRIAEELSSPLGQTVGYKVRFSDHTQPQTYIKLMTDGILLAEIQHDPNLLQYDTIIIDEAHERSLNIDFLLGYLKNILPKRPDLKIIITSATINTERFSSFFHGAPIIEVSGRSYPVDIEYRPPSEDTKQVDQAFQQAIIDAVHEAGSLDALGDILIFLPGEREIRDVSHALHHQNFRDSEILPLYSRLSPAEQDKIFRTHTGRRIVLATNVAETSLTVPGIRFVIDSGLARISRYSVKNKVQQLPIEAISQASANQRAGRCGRIAAGICFRLYSQDDFKQRPKHTEPEIRRTNLAHVILQMINLGLGDIHQFSFMEPPEKRNIQDGFRLLEELQAIDVDDSDGKLTRIGKQLVRLPIDPRLARMLMASDSQRALHEVLIIVAGLSVQDPKIRPAESAPQADEKHRIFTDPTSDFLSWFKLWQWYHEQAHHLSKSKLRKTCESHFLSYLRMREWHDLHGQLLGIVREMGMTPNAEAAKPDDIHKSILSGLLGHIAMKHDEKGIVGARNVQVTLFPGSPLSKKPPKWMMAASWVETSRLFARCIAPIDPTWLEPLAQHLIKRSYSEPHWSKKRAQVCAFESITLYGLPIIHRRSIHFGSIEPDTCRDIFIRSALVNHEFHSFGKWFKHNQALLKEIEILEAKSRRALLVDEQTRVDFFDAIIPDEVCSGKLFEQWRKKAEQKQPDILCFSKAFLLNEKNNAMGEEAFPDTLHINGLKLKLSYHFAASEPDAKQHADGITLHVPILALGQLQTPRFDWLVPGMLADKITALLKALPKSLRKHVVPVPQFAQACMDSMHFAEGPLLANIAKHLKRMTGMDIHPRDWNLEALPTYLRMSFNILDEKGKTIATGHDLAHLQQQYAHLARANIQQTTAQHFKPEQRYTRWDFEDLPVSVRQNKHGMHIQLFPALVDKQTCVVIELFESQSAAKQAMLGGIRRLLMLQLHQQVELLRKKMPHQRELALFYASIGKSQDLLDDIIQQTFDVVFLSDHVQNNLPRSQHDFEQLFNAGRAKVVSQAQAIAEHVLATLKTHAALQQSLQQSTAMALKAVVDDITAQMNTLIHAGFVSHTPIQWLPHLPRFLQAADIRLSKAGQNLKQDQSNMLHIHALWQRYSQEYTQRELRLESLDTLIEYRWLIEELRVSMFAQQLKTSQPISLKRMEKHWQALTQ